MSVQKSPAFRFDGTNPGAQKAAERQAAKMVTNVSDETRAAIRSVVTRSIREGIPPYDAARAIRPLIGMTTQQAQAALNYRFQLIDSGLSLERVNVLTDRYAERKIAERADMIARTEIIDSLNDGALEAWGQAQDEGLLSDSATKEVIVTPDEKTCPTCDGADGQVQPLDQPFETDDGNFDMPPFHPQCRCTAAVNP